MRDTVIFCYPLKLSFHLAYPCRPLFCRLTQAFESFLDFGIRGLVMLGDQVKSYGQIHSFGEIIEIQQIRATSKHVEGLLRLFAHDEEDRGFGLGGTRTD